MDNNIYELVKQAMKEGRCIDDLIDDVITASNSLNNTTPTIEEQILDTADRIISGQEFLKDVNGKINTDKLIVLISAWFIQNGFKADNVTKDINEIYKSVYNLLKSDLSICKTCEKFANDSERLLHNKDGEDPRSTLLDTLKDFFSKI